MSLNFQVNVVEAFQATRNTYSWDIKRNRSNNNTQHTHFNVSAGRVHFIESLGRKQNVERAPFERLTHSIKVTSRA